MSEEYQGYGDPFLTKNEDGTFNIYFLSNVDECKRKVAYRENLSGIDRWVESNEEYFARLTELARQGKIVVIRNLKNE